ncbi:tumor necrosis factor alpha-induced protein 3-like [Sycon ciliatum]|uniref:tumor necrosis factor alpha-induced protein 3-like n=1 Tax=Sycon ciliatum TaxID=27933 RepID=UPI0031F6B907
MAGGSTMPSTAIHRRNRSLEDADPRLAEEAHEFIDSRLELLRRSQDASRDKIPVICKPLTSYNLDFIFGFVNSLDEERRKFVYRSVFDGDTQRALERDGVINWPEAHAMDRLRSVEQQICKLVPLRTRGDGNCLLHAVSLAMWGVDDTSLRLRSALHLAVVHSTAEEKLRNRWRRAVDAENRRIGVQLEEHQWHVEWMTHVVRISEPRPKANTQMYESLGEFHIFILAQVLRRPIICYAAATMPGAHGERFAPVNMAGIYLPLTAHPVDCVRSPLLIAFTGGHFVGLVRKNNTGLVPLCRKDMSRLPIQFLEPSESGNKEKLLDRYLAHSYAQMPPSATSDVFMTFQPMDIATFEPVDMPPELQALAQAYVDNFEELYCADVATRCRGAGCENYHMEQSPFCSRCVKTQPPSPPAVRSDVPGDMDAAGEVSSMNGAMSSQAPLAPSAPILRDSSSELDLHLINPRYCNELGCLKDSETHLGGFCGECYDRRQASPLTRNPPPRRSHLSGSGTGGGEQRPGSAGASVSSVDPPPPLHHSHSSPPSDPSTDLGSAADGAYNDENVSDMPLMCIEPNCRHFGSTEFGGRCSRCYVHHQTRERRQRPASNVCHHAGCQRKASAGSASRFCEFHSLSSGSGSTRSNSSPAALSSAGNSATSAARVQPKAAPNARSPLSAADTCCTPGCARTDLSSGRDFCSRCVRDMERLWLSTRQHTRRWQCGKSGCSRLVDMPQEFCSHCQPRNPPRARPSPPTLHACRRSPRCKEQFDESVYRMYGGLCRNCFMELGGETRCKTSGCPYYGSLRHAGFCSNCAERQKRERIALQQRAALRDLRTITRQGNPLDDFTPATAATSAQDQCCVGCGRFGSLLDQQLCKDCFYKRYSSSAPRTTHHVLNDIS